MIQLFHVYKSFGENKALNDVSVEIAKGELVYLTGPSGAGKSTLLRLVFAADTPTRGQVFVGGKNLTRLTTKAIPFLRRNLGVVFQDFKLLPNRTVGENVAVALEVLGMPRDTIQKRVFEMLRRVGLAHKLHQLPRALSGGEQQRVAIARALVADPQIVLADEPTGNLDAQRAEEIMLLLEDANTRGATVVVATHDRELLKRGQRRVLHLEAGKLSAACPMLRRAGYFITRAFAALRESPAMSVVTTLTIAAALIVLGVFAVGFIAVDGFTTAWGRVATVTAYINDDARTEEWSHIRDRVAILPGVAKATLVTPEEALDAFKERGAEAAALVEGVSSALLPASVEVEVTNDAATLEQVQALAHHVAAIDGVVDVDYGREDHARFSALARVIRFGGAAAALLVALATAFIVSNTIRLTVFARRSEIGILKLVGATNGFVRLPFLLEGAIWGACGGGFAALFLWLSDRLVARELDVSSLIGANHIRFFGPELAYGLLATGTALGIAGAMLAVRRFLDVEPS